MRETGRRRSESAESAVTEVDSEVAVFAKTRLKIGLHADTCCKDLNAIKFSNQTFIG